MGRRSGGHITFRELIAACRRICLDTNACIYYLGQTDPPFPAMVEIALEGSERGLPTHIAGLTYLELLVRPWRDGTDAHRRIIEEFVLEASGAPPQPITVDELEVAAQIRAMTRMKTPDALIAASAAIHGCDVVIGNDTDFKGLAAIESMQIARRGRRPLQLPRFVLLKDYVNNVG
jgi:predicted nucleic acid-binding protein